MLAGTPVPLRFNHVGLVTKKRSEKHDKGRLLALGLGVVLIANHPIY